MSSGAGEGMSVDLGHDVFMGHEFSAEILEAGPDTETLPAGTLVTSIPVLLSGNNIEPIVYSNTDAGRLTPSGCCSRRRCCCPFPTA